MKFVVSTLKSLAALAWFHSAIVAAVVITAVIAYRADIKPAMAAGLVTMFLGVLMGIYERLCDLVRAGNASHATLNVNFPPIQADAVAAFMAAKNKEQA